MKRFEIFYTGNTIVSGTTIQEWIDAPETGVQAIIYLHDDNCAREKVYGYDYYNLQDDGFIVGSDTEQIGITKLGELISREDYNNIIDALEDHSLIWHVDFRENES